MEYARIVHYGVKHGKVDEFYRLMQTEVLPLLKEEKGFHQNLTVLGSDSGMSISVWDDRNSAEAYDAKTYPEILKRLGPVLEGTPRVETFGTILTAAR